MIEQITLQEATGEMIVQLEKTLGKLSIAAESGLSTSTLESNAQKLAAKLKTSAELLSSLILYKGVKGTELRSWNIDEELKESNWLKYASLCKRCGKEQLDVRKEDNYYYTEITEGIFVRLEDLPEIEMPQFKIKIEGNTLMAVRADLLAKLPEKTKKLLKGEETEDE